MYFAMTISTNNITFHDSKPKLPWQESNLRQSGSKPLTRTSTGPTAVEMIGIEPTKDCLPDNCDSQQSPHPQIV